MTRVVTVDQMVKPQAPQESLSREQLGLVIRNKKHFWNAMVQDGWMMPDYKQTIVSIKFMHAVRAKEVWAPRAEDTMQCRRVAYPPTNGMLLFYLNMVVDELDEDPEWTKERLAPIRRLLELLKKKSADKAWLLLCPWVLKEDCLVFDKSYRYVKPRQLNQPDTIRLIENEDGFFDNLPPLLPHERKGRLMCMSKADKQYVKMQVYEARQRDLEQKMARLRQEMQQDEAGDAANDGRANGQPADRRPA